MKRGDIVFVRCEKFKHTGSEITCSRPAVIVSNDKCNEFSPVVEVVYCTTVKKKYLPTHVILHSTEKTSIALCEGIYSVDKSRIIKKIGSIDMKELLLINNALAVSVGLV